jgi:DNA-binding NarL/FixJ family response regulator
VRALIIDDHPLFSSGLRLLLLGSATFKDIVCCESGAEALQLARDVEFDLVLLDWNLGSALSGAPLIAQLKDALPGASVVVVSGESAPGLVKLAIESGAVGYVPKESTSALLIDALNITAHGGIYLPATVLSESAAGSKAASTATAAGGGLRSIADAFPQLTFRQIDVLSHLVRGMQNKEIARELDITDGTVKQHINAIFRELDVRTRTEAVYLLAKGGIRFE